MLWNLGTDVTDVRQKRARKGREYVWSLATRGGQRVRLSVKADGPGEAGIVKTTLVRGQREPLLGWYSPAQGVLRPATTLVVRLRRDPTVSVTTEVEVEEGACSSHPSGAATR
jgi:hypothetical protein